jgi:ATP-dependent Lhr-like helicase
VLLERYGVLMRELVTRETNAPPWRELLGSLRRMEHRGEVRGGRFVSGTIGEQFALPDAVESLRAHRHRPPDGHVIRISAADPLNLAGILVPGDRVPAQSGRSIAWQDGVPLPSCPSTDRRAG